MSQGLIKEFLSGSNMMETHKLVKQNNGSAGNDGITTDGIDDCIKASELKTIRERMRQRKYKP